MLHQFTLNQQKKLLWVFFVISMGTKMTRKLTKLKILFLHNKAQLL